MHQKNKFYKFTEEQANELFVRFILNAPEESFLQPEDFCLLLESAFYFYSDRMIGIEPNFIKDKNQFKALCCGLFSKIPQLAPLRKYSDQLYNIHKKHYNQANTTGCICFNKDLTHVLVVHQHANILMYAFPKGKMSKGESYVEASIRETLEETGIDVSNYIDENESKVYHRSHRSNVKLFNVILPIPITDKLVSPSPLEVSLVRWVKITDIGNEKEYEPDSLTYSLIDEIQKWADEHKSSSS